MAQTTTRALIASGIALTAGTAWMVSQRFGAEIRPREEAAATDQAKAPVGHPHATRFRTVKDVRHPDSEDRTLATDQHFDGTDGAQTTDEIADFEEPAMPVTTEELEFEFDSEVGRRDLVEVERAIERSVATVNSPGTKLERVECRASMCRAAFTFDNDETERSFLQEFLFPKERTADTAQHGSMSGIIPEREKLEDGSRRVVMYLHKNG